MQAWGLLEQKAGNLDRARELFQQGVWAQPGSKDVTYVWQAWGILEAEAGDPQLARQLFKCAVKADPDSVPSWTVRPSPLAHKRVCPCRGVELSCERWHGGCCHVGFCVTRRSPADMPPSTPVLLFVCACAHTLV